jgi:hypothetical protein
LSADLKNSDAMEQGEVIELLVPFLGTNPNIDKGIVSNNNNNEFSFSLSHFLTGNSKLRNANVVPSLPIESQSTGTSSSCRHYSIPSRFHRRKWTTKRTRLECFLHFACHFSENAHTSLRTEELPLVHQLAEHALVHRSNGGLDNVGTVQRPREHQH